MRAIVAGDPGVVRHQVRPDHLAGLGVELPEHAAEVPEVHGVRPRPPASPRRRPRSSPPTSARGGARSSGGSCARTADCACSPDRGRSSATPIVRRRRRCGRAVAANAATSVMTIATLPAIVMPPSDSLPVGTTDVPPAARRRTSRCRPAAIFFSGVSSAGIVVTHCPPPVPTGTARYCRAVHRVGDRKALDRRRKPRLKEDLARSPHRARRDSGPSRRRRPGRRRSSAPTVFGGVRVRCRHSISPGLARASRATRRCRRGFRDASGSCGARRRLRRRLRRA